MKFLEALKQNLPVLLLMSVVPYFFYNNPTLPQAIIAAIIGGVAAFKYYLEIKEQPDYVKMFEEQMEERRIQFNKALDENHKNVMKEIEVLRAKHNGQTIQRNIDSKINMRGWG